MGLHADVWGARVREGQREIEGQLGHKGLADSREIPGQLEHRGQRGTREIKAIRARTVCRARRDQPVLRTTRQRRGVTTTPISCCPIFGGERAGEARNVCSGRSDGQRDLLVKESSVKYPEAIDWQ